MCQFDNLIKYRLNLRAPIGFLVLGNEGGSRQNALEVRIEFVCENRNNVETKAIPGKTAILIRGILAANKAFGIRPGPDFGTGFREKRADEPSVGNKTHAGQTGSSSSTDQAKQHRFGLIGAVMTDSDPIHQFFLDAAGEKPAADEPGSLFQIPFICNGFGTNYQTESERFRQPRDKFPVLFRLGAAKLVVDV